jgi:hypothetical protein
VLGIMSNSQLSPELEQCCLLVSANSSYVRAAEDIEVLTGIKVSHSTQHRLVHQVSIAEEIATESIEAISIDGGKIRIRTPQGEPCVWRDYKAVNLDTKVVGAFFQENAELTDWVNQQPLPEIFSCLGDGHDGIWNLFAGIRTDMERCETLDWYHLVENLYKTNLSDEQHLKIKELLWQGDVDAVIDKLGSLPDKGVINFLAYLRKHKPRIPNYNYFQLEGIPIGSGSVESLVKQIDRRVKISGAQWSSKNIPQVLKQRCAYLNGYFSPKHHEHNYSSQI